MVTHRISTASKTVGLEASFYCLAIVAVSSTVLMLPATYSAKAEAAKYVVLNTNVPDLFLALRTEPSSTSGRRLEEMPNLTWVQVMKKRPDGWWQVRDLATGQTGWALSGNKTTTWIIDPSVPTSHGDPAQVVHAALDPIFQQKDGAFNNETRFFSKSVKVRADAYFSVDDNNRDFDADWLIGSQDMSDMKGDFSTDFLDARHAIVTVSFRDSHGATAKDPNRYHLVFNELPGWAIQDIDYGDNGSFSDVIFKDVIKAGACKEIANACKDKGFLADKADEGRRLIEDCLVPVLTDSTADDNSGLPHIGERAFNECRMQTTPAEKLALAHPSNSSTIRDEPPDTPTPPQAVGAPGDGPTVARTGVPQTGQIAASPSPQPAEKPHRRYSSAQELLTSGDFSTIEERNAAIAEFNSQAAERDAAAAKEQEDKKRAVEVEQEKQADAVRNVVPTKGPGFLKDHYSEWEASDPKTR